MPSFQLVLQFRGATIEDMNEVLAVEEALFEVLNDREELEGHSVSSAARNIFIATDDPDATFRRLTPFLERAGLLTSLIAAARSLREERYRVLWPHGWRDVFSLT